ncbi:GNAT family N-acetyltransferase [Paenibacillus glycanilyticus]|uniref:Acetyltransferase n=1 Tax=Paenibacillus glycanilyticus TaxID=126569 RepID=A0ABQ6GFH6_9BACL|nr:GNAT family N-acetyltransferase [Paenibacillus glycanilyticus]GLX68088.1 acetyltransferase [Paenibacillus glycanilyticus]
MSHIELRLIEENELEEALRLEQRCYTPEAAATGEGFRYRFDQYKDYFWSAWSGGKLLGITNGIRTKAWSCGDEMKGSQQDEEEGNNFCILTVAVAEEARRQGIGAMLLNRLLAVCDAMGHDAVLLMCEQHLVSFYEQAGFTYAGLAASSHGGIEWHEMRRTLHIMEHLTK